MTDPRQSTSSPDASVLICTRNRGALLGEVLEHLLGEDIPGEAGRDLAWEVVVVDNDSTDDTPAIVRRVAEAHPGRVRVVHEGEMGLSAARNAGIRAARGAVQIFLDDDAFPHPGWLGHLVGAFQGDPQVLCAGGPVDPEFEGSLPDWFDDGYLPYLSAWDRGPDPEELVYNEYPRGANIAFRRQVFERFGGFSTHLGRKGKDLLSGEEVELCLRIERTGGKILYVPEARVDHRVNAHRVTRDWLAERFFAQGRSEAIIDWIHGGLRGLRVGSERFAKNAVAVRRPGTDPILRRCQTRAMAGYLRGSAEAARKIPRFQSREGRLEAWVPVVGG